MIKIILGGVGSGKTLSAVKKIIDHRELCFTNFDVKAPNTKRLLMSNVIIPHDTKKNAVMVNWDFWRSAIEAHDGFHIFIDELHNIMHARTAMSKQNIAMSQWVAQIRKVTGANEHHHFYCISQELERIDVSVRDLAHEIIYCEKATTNRLRETIVRDGKRTRKKLLSHIYIRQTHFVGLGATERYYRWRVGDVKTHNYRTGFLGNRYIKYYDSYELIDFGRTEFL